MPKNSTENTICAWRNKNDKSYEGVIGGVNEPKT
jgi:hypothetical protein